MDYMTCHCQKQDWEDLNTRRLNTRGVDIMCKSCGIMYQVKTGVANVLKYDDLRIPCGKRHVIVDCLEKFSGKFCFAYICYDPDNYNIKYIIQSNLIGCKNLDPISDVVNIRRSDYWVYTI